MAVLTQDVQRPHKGMDARKVLQIPMAGYTNFASGNTEHTIFKGSIVIIDVSDTDGYARACPDSGSVNAAAGDIFCGIALERQKVTLNDTADGAKLVSVARDGVWAFPKGGVAQTDIGAPAYASDDATITATSTNNFWVGTIMGVDATYVYVDIHTAAGRVLAAAA